MSEQSTDTSQRRQPREFGDIIAELREGRTAQELAQKLQELTHAVEAFEKSGSLTLTITITPERKGLKVTDKIVMKKPEPSRASTFMFSTPEGNLSRKDPRQIDLQLKEPSQDKGQPGAASA